MSQLKAKQIKLLSQGDLIVGDTSGNGSILHQGSTSQVLTSTSTGVQYSYLDTLRDSTTGAVVAQTSASKLIALNPTTSSDSDNTYVTKGYLTTTLTGITYNRIHDETNTTFVDTETNPNAVTIGAPNTAGTSQSIAEFQAVDGVTNGEHFVITNGNGKVVINAVDNTASNTTPNNVDIVLQPQGDGQVYIGRSTATAGGSTETTVTGEAGDTIYIKSGDAATTDGSGNNLVLSGGNGNGTGSNGLVIAPTGYTIPDTAPVETFTTVGYVTAQINKIIVTETRDEKHIVTAPFSNYFFTLSYTPTGDVEILYNGIVLEPESYTVIGTALTLIDSVIGYSVDVGDIIQARYGYYSA